MTGVRRSAFVGRPEQVEGGGKRVLVVEPTPQAPPTLRSSLLERLEWAQLDQVLVVDRIPVDQRHNAKIDYPALETMLRRGGRGLGELCV